MPITERFAIGNTSEIQILVSSAASGGALTVFAETCGPSYGPPPHVHSREDEYLLPSEGTFDVLVDGQWEPLGKGGIYTPRGTLHTWRNSGAATGTILFVVTPGGFEFFLKKLAHLKLPEQMDELVSISADHGISYPTLPPA